MDCTSHTCPAPAPVRVDQIGYKMINTKYNDISFKYQKTIVEQLPRPFKSDCVEYSRKGYNSHEECLLKCKIDH